MRWKPFPQGLLLALCLSASSRAAVFTWDGGGTTNDNWSTAANWVGDVVPPNNGSADIIFAGSTRLSPNADANWSVTSLSFSAGAGAFQLGGNQLTIGGGGISNNSSITQMINDPIVLGAGQTWNANSGALMLGVAGTVDTAGFPLVISGGKGATIGAPVTNSGMIHVTSGSAATFNGTLTNSGSMVIDSSATVGVSQPYTAAGSFTNNGSIVFGSNYTGTIGIGGIGSTFFSGGVSTGAGSTASLNFGGSVTIFNELLERLAGPDPTQYDSIYVGGILNLKGTLDVALAGGFTPAAGNSFNLLHWSVRSGGFKTINLPALGPGVAWSTLKLYSHGAIAAVDANLIPGDLTHNAKVDVADISALEGALRDLSSYQNGRGLTDLQLRQVADLNNDARVNNLDLQALLNFEAQLAATGTASIAAVPEPPAFVLIAFGALAIVACGNRIGIRSGV